MAKRIYITDEVVKDVRRIKEQLAELMDFDIDRMLEDARQRQRNSGRTVLPPPVGQRA
jgi:hypothetical protein